MRAKFTGLIAALMAAALMAQRLDKPSLENNLDHLQKGLLEYLHLAYSTYKKKMAPGWIPADCKAFTETQNLSTADVETFNVRYVDVDTRFTRSFSQVSKSV